MKHFLKVSKHPFFFLSLGVLMLLAGVRDAHGQVNNFSSNQLTATATVYNECDGSEDGRIQFDVLTAAPGVTQVRLVFVSGPAGPDDKYSLFPAPQIFLSVPGTFTFYGSTDVGATPLSAASLIDGTYSFRLQEVSGTNIINGSVDLEDLNPIVIDAFTETDNTVCGGADGEIDITVSGGSGNLLYSWDNGETTEDIVGLVSADYEVTITDEFSSCSLTQQFTVFDPNPLDFEIATSTPTVCEGDDIIITVGQPNATDPAEFDVEYELEVNGSAVGSVPTQTGDGATTITFTLPSADYTSGQDIQVIGRLAGCFDKPSNVITVTKNPLPTITLGTGPELCAEETSASISVTGVTNGADEYTIDYDTDAENQGFVDVTTFTALGGSIPIDVPVAALADVYNATVTVRNSSTGCESDAGSPEPFTVTVLALPTPFNMTGGNPVICDEETAPIGLDNSEAGVDYVLFFNTSTAVDTVAGTGAAIDFEEQGEDGDYTVLAVNSSSDCQEDMVGMVTITVNPLPTVFNVTGDDEICFGAPGVPVNLSGSQVGVDYILVLDGTTDLATEPGTGAAISFGNQTEGTYTVRAVNTATGCEEDMNGDAVIELVPLPTIYNITGSDATICSDESVSLGLSDSDTGINYILMLDGTDILPAVAGTGNAITFAAQSDAGVYTVRAEHATAGCQENMNGTVTIAVNPIPADFTVSGGGTICEGDPGVAIELSGSEVGVDYTLMRGATSVDLVSGDGGPLSFDVQTTAGTYTVIAENTVTGCDTQMSASAVVTVNQLPVIYTVSGTNTICDGQTTVISLSDSDNGIDYILVRGGAVNVDTVAGNGSAINFAAQSLAGTYTVLAQNTLTDCEEQMASSAVITVNPLPTQYTVSGGGAICSTDNASIDLSDSDVGFEYTLIRGVADVTTVPGTGDPLSFSQSTDGTYTIRAENTTTGCTEIMSASAVITVFPAAVANAGSDQGLCIGESVTLTGSSVSGSATVGTWSIFSQPGTGDGVLGFTGATNPTDTVTFTATVAGAYVLRLTTDDPGAPCAAVTDDVTITVANVATANAGLDDELCSGSEMTLAGSSVGGSAANGTWTIFSQPAADGQLGYTGASDPAETDTVTFTAVTPGAYVLRLTTNDPPGFCSSAMDAVTITVVQTPTVEAGLPQDLCGGDDAVLSGSAIGGAAITGTWTIVTQPGGGDGQLGHTTATDQPDTVTFTASVAGAYTLRLTTDDPATSCDAVADDVVITVMTAATAVAGPNQGLCTGETLTLTGSSVGGSATVGTWSIQNQPGGGDGQLGFTGTTNPTDTVTFTASVLGVYTLRLTTDDPAGLCLPEFSEMTVTVANDATAEAGAALEVCSGSAIDLSGASIGGSASLGTWTIISQPGGGDGQLDVAVGTAEPDTATFTATVVGDYILELNTDDPAGTCLPASDQITITVSQPATANAGAVQDFCPGETITLTGSSIGGTAANGTWTIDSQPGSGDGQLGFTGVTDAPDTVTFTASVVGDYTLRLTTDDPSGNCGPVSSTVTVTVNTPPVPTIGGSLSTCFDSEVTYTTEAGQTNYVWTVQGGTVVSGGTGFDNVDIDWDEAGPYTVSVGYEDAAGCSGSVTETVTITTLPTATLSGDNAICQNESSNLTITLTGAAPWDIVYNDGFANTAITGIASSPATIAVTPSASRSYSLVSVTNAACGAGTVAGTADIIVTPIAGNPLTNGVDTWLGYVYNDSGNPYPPLTDINFNLSKYRGYIESTDIDGITGLSSYDVATDAFDLNLGSTALSGANLCGAYDTTYSIRFRMRKTFAAGLYTFTVGADDGIRMFLDGVAVTLSPAGSFDLHTYTQYTSNTLSVSAGQHTLILEYFQHTDQARASFDYTLASGPDLTSTGDVCVNTASPTLTASSADPGVIGYRWYSDATLTTLVSSSANYTPASPGELDLTVAGVTTFYATAVYAAGETLPSSIDVEVLASAVITATDNSICESSGLFDLNTTVTAVPAGGDFVFTGTNVNTATDEFDPTALTGQTISIQVDYANGSCVATATFDIDVTDNATFTLPGTNPQICENGGLVDLNTLVSGETPSGGEFVFGGGAYVNTLTDELDPAGQSGTITISVDYSSGGCIAPQQTLSVDIVTAPVVSLVAASINACQDGATVDLSDNVQSTAPSGGTFTFTDNTGFSEIFGDVYDPTGVAASTQNITVAYTAPGCAATTTTSFDIVVLPAPAVTVDNSALACRDGADVDLLTLVSGTPSGGTFAFSGTGVTGSTLSPAGLLGTQTIQVDYTESGCTTSTNLSVLVNVAPNPASVITATPDLICAGGSSMIVINSQANILYQLRYNSDNTPIGGQFLGTGFSLGLPTPALTDTTEFNVVATAIDGSCISQLTTIVTVTTRATDDALCGSGGGGGPLGNEDCSLFSSGDPGSTLPYGIPPSCSGADNGQIVFNITGGDTSGSYTVLVIDSVASTSTSGNGLVGTDIVIGNLAPAQYWYRIIDANGDYCTLPFLLEREEPLTAVASNFSGQQCPDVNDGAATITVTSTGSSNYEYSVVGDFSDARSFVSGGDPVTNLPPGAYNIAVRDITRPQCVAVVAVNIAQTLTPRVTELQPPSKTDATCDGNGQDGTITVFLDLSGGANYTFKWGVANGLLDDLEQFPAGGVFTGLDANVPGEHYQLVVDSNLGCAADTFDLPNITFPGLVTYSNVVITEPTCTGDGKDGRVRFDIANNTVVGSYEMAIMISPSQIPADEDYFPASLNPVTVSDTLQARTYYIWLRSLGETCPTIATIDVDGAVPVEFSATPVNEACFGDGGAIVISAIEGVTGFNFDYEIKRNGQVDSIGSFTYNESFGNIEVAELEPGDYEVILSQPGTILDCLVPAKELVILGPASPLTITDRFIDDTEAISLPEVATGAARISVNGGGAFPNQGLDFYQVWLADSSFISSIVRDTTDAMVGVDVDFRGLPPGDYAAGVVDFWGCVQYTYFEIGTDKSVYIPNLFTPNNDQINDVFEILNLGEVAGAVAKIRITNRWGNEVFSSDDYYNNWWDAKDAADGVYFYMLNFAGKDYSGWVEIIRGDKP